MLKVFLRSSRLGEDELLALARRVVDPSVAELTHAGLGFIEVLPPGVTKATGLAVALEHHARTIPGLWDAIGRLIDTFTPAECANYFAAATARRAMTPTRWAR